MTESCPECGQANRPGARFCGACGAALTPPPAAADAADIARQAQQALAKAGAVIGPAAARAGAAVAPVAKEAAAKGWAGSVRGMSFLARVATIGGRAAYSELFGPLPVAGGQVVSVPVEAAVPAAVEPAAILFVLALLMGWLVLGLPATGWILLASIAALLTFSWLGVRRPYFTRLTFEGLWTRLRSGGRPAQTPIYRFQVAVRGTGQPVEVVMVGPRQGAAVAQAATVELWGVLHPDRNELRAWRAETVDAMGRTLSVTTAPRLIPLTVALFLPALLLLLVWILTAIF
jgi:hypothetical protein